MELADGMLGGCGVGRRRWKGLVALGGADSQFKYVSCSCLLPLCSTSSLVRRIANRLVALGSPPSPPGPLSRLLRRGRGGGLRSFMRGALGAFFGSFAFDPGVLRVAWFGISAAIEGGVYTKPDG